MMNAWNDMNKLMLTALVAGVLSLGATGVGAKGNQGANSIDQLTADWYEWQETYYPGFSFGEDCSLGQNGAIWFLGGTGGGDPVVRECYDPVPAGKRLFFPLVNLVAYDEESPRELLEDLFSDLDAEDLFGGAQTCKLNAVLDDQPVIFSGIPIQRVQSPSFAYQGDPQAVADGYWVLLPKLPLGEHTIQFSGGLCVSAGSVYTNPEICEEVPGPDDVPCLEAGDELFKVDVTYILHVVK